MLLIWEDGYKALFTKIYDFLVNVALSFVFGNYCPTMD